MITNWDQLPLNLRPEDLWRRGIIPVGKQAVYALCHTPGFPVVRIGKRKYIIPRDPLRSWLQKQASMGAE